MNLGYLLKIKARNLHSRTSDRNSGIMREQDRSFSSYGTRTIEETDESETDEEERKIKDIDQKCRLCFIDIISKKIKGAKTVK